jgi:hypothetical protein
MPRPNRKEYDWTPASLLACTGLASAFATMCISYPLGHYAVMKGRLADFSQIFVPGVLFGAAISGFLAFRGYLRSRWKVIAVCFECAVAYLLAVWTAAGVELFSRFLDYDARGVVSWQSLVIGGFVGGLCILYSISFLLNSESTRKRRISRALYWGAAGGILGIAGWSLGPFVGMAFWQIVSSMNLTAPTETYQNALFGQTSHMYSLLAVWQAGMGAVIGLTVSTRMPQEAQTWRTLT